MIHENEKVNGGDASASDHEVGNRIELWAKQAIYHFKGEGLERTKPHLYQLHDMLINLLNEGQLIQMRASRVRDRKDVARTEGRTPASAGTPKSDNIKRNLKALGIDMDAGKGLGDTTTMGERFGTPFTLEDGPRDLGNKLQDRHGNLIALLEKDCAYSSSFSRFLLEALNSYYPTQAELARLTSSSKADREVIQELVERLSGHQHDGHEWTPWAAGKEHIPGQCRTCLDAVLIAKALSTLNK